MLQKGAPIMPFSVAVMMSVGMCGRGGRCGAEDMVEGLDDGGGGGEADVRWWDEELCSVVVVVIVVSVVSTGFDGKAKFLVSMSIHNSPSLDITSAGICYPCTYHRFRNRRVGYSSASSRSCQSIYRVG